MGYQSKVRGNLLVVALGVALSACSGNTSHDGNSAGAGGMKAAGGSSSASSGGASNSGGVLGNATGGISGNATGGAGSVDISSDPGSGMCTDFTPCGGDVLGTWRIESICLDPVPLDGLNCPGATTSISIVGSLTFNSDGTYVPSGTSMARLTVPAACSSLCTAACTTSSGGGCVCDSTMPVSTTATPYSVSGTKLIVQPQAGVTQTAYFCRNGDQLFMRGYSTAATRYQYNLKRESP